MTWPQILITAAVIVVAVAAFFARRLSLRHSGTILDVSAVSGSRAEVHVSVGESPIGDIVGIDQGYPGDPTPSALKSKTKPKPQP